MFHDLLLIVYIFQHFFFSEFVSIVNHVALFLSHSSHCAAVVLLPTFPSSSPYLTVSNWPRKWLILRMSYIIKHCGSDVYSDHAVRLGVVSQFTYNCKQQRYSCRTLTIALTSLVTWLPVFNPPSLPGLSLTINKSRILCSSTPTLPAIFAKRSYVLFRVSFTTLTSKKLACCLNSAALNSQNLSGAAFRTATPASCVNVDEGCHGCMC